MPRAVDASRIGLRLARDGWPSTLPYLLCPPLTIQAVLVIQPWIATKGSLAYLLTASVISTIVSLVFKGAITRQYLRELAERVANEPPPDPRKVSI
ncbi:MAG: hypothetical protein ACYDAY_05390 [Candidatus Dormibacteria bacterium]